MNTSAGHPDAPDLIGAQREQLQSAIVERMSEGVLLLAPDAAILFANPAAERLFGCEPGGLNGRNAQVLSFRSAANFDGLVRAVFEGTADGRTAVIDLEGRRSDGSLYPLQGCFSPMIHGGRRCLIAVMTDVSERKQLESELMRVATRVQQRVGSDLYNGLSQQLAGIAMMLQGLGKRAGRAGSAALGGDLEDIIRQLNGAIRSARSLARGLSPVRPTREGLMEGFVELANHVRELHGMHVGIDVDLPDGIMLDESVATHLYRIAQEGVLNAARHAAATRIQLRLRVAGPDLELQVADDGNGFDPLQHGRGGTGLRVMGFRAQLVGGYLSVESRSGAGTVLRCHCPLKLSQEAA